MAVGACTPARLSAWPARRPGQPGAPAGGDGIGPPSRPAVCFPVLAAAALAESIVATAPLDDEHVVARCATLAMPRSSRSSSALQPAPLPPGAPADWRGRRGRRRPAGGLGAGLPAPSTSFAGRARFSTWLSKIALHDAWARVKARRRLRPEAAAGEEASSWRSPCRPPRQSARRRSASCRLLHDAVERLPPSLRMGSSCAKVEGLSTRRPPSYSRSRRRTPGYAAPRPCRPRGDLERRLGAEASRLTVRRRPLRPHRRRCDAGDRVSAERGEDSEGAGWWARPTLQEASSHERSRLFHAGWPPFPRAGVLRGPARVGHAHHPLFCYRATMPPG